jgi:hypothetical protein
MISISFQGLCGEDDVRFLREEEARTYVVNERDSAGQKVKICSEIGSFFNSSIILGSYQISTY